MDGKPGWEGKDAHPSSLQHWAQWSPCGSALTVLLSAGSELGERAAQQLSGNPLHIPHPPDKGEGPAAQVGPHQGSSRRSKTLSPLDPREAPET